MVPVGKKAPDFTLPDRTGKQFTLSDFHGKWVLIYFYPKDDTPGCTTEACTIRDAYNDFVKQGIVVLGISTDSQKSHEKFVTKFKLPFTLLADEDKKVVQLYGVWGKKKFMGREYLGTQRASVLVDREGKVAKVYEAVKPAEHAAEVLADIAAFQH